MPSIPSASAYAACDMAWKRLCRLMPPVYDLLALMPPSAYVPITAGSYPAPQHTTALVRHVPPMGHYNHLAKTMHPLLNYQQLVLLSI